MHPCIYYPQKPFTEWKCSAYTELEVSVIVHDTIIQESSDRITAAVQISLTENTFPLIFTAESNSDADILDTQRATGIICHFNNILHCNVKFYINPQTQISILHPSPPKYLPIQTVAIACKTSIWLVLLSMMADLS